MLRFIPGSPSLNSIPLNIFGRSVRINTNDAFLRGILWNCYSAFVSSVADTDAAAVEMTVVRERERHTVSVIHQDSVTDCQDLADVLYVVDKTLTIELQRRRPELYFLHAAAVASNGLSLAIVGESGAGKSTFCWDLCNAGFSYVSDELVPVDLFRMEIQPYPRAVCLKRELGQMPALPLATIRTGASLHIPAGSLPGGYEITPQRLRAFVFLRNDESVTAPRLVPLAASESAARFYANGLNQLAHERCGLGAAAALAAAAPCFSLNRGNLRAMRSALSELCDLQLAS